MTARVDSGPARPRGQRHTRLQTPAPTAILRPMQAQPVTFDTHAFVKRLTRAGMPEDQAEILSNGQADLYERLVTKEHFEFTLTHELEKLRVELKNDIDKVQANLEQVKAELKSDIDKVQANLETVRAELKHDIETLRAELKSDIDKVQANLEQVKAELKRDIEIVRAELKLDIEKLRADLEHKFNQQEAAIREMEQKLTIKLGSIVVIGITVLSVLDKLF